MSTALHPCLRCGACCVSLRCSFYWAEATDGHGDVPVELTEPITPFLRAMKGWNATPMRCVALEGTVAQEVRCSIHAVRPSVCRDFPPSYEDGTHHDRCDEARLKHGLAALTLDDWRAFRAAQGTSPEDQ